jgi:hypothetical protein
MHPKQVSIADMTFSWLRLTWPALALRHAAPWARKRSATTIATDPKHLGARIGLTAVLHTWGSALTHHPHVHVIVPGGGLAHRRT